jgi:hypothetical protein
MEWQIEKPENYRILCSLLDGWSPCVNSLLPTFGGTAGEPE